MNLFRVFVNLFRFNKTNWKAVSGCLLAAVVFWLFNALNKNYATNVRFPLKFEFDRRKYVPSQLLPSDIYLNVSGNGWNLFRKVLDIKKEALLIPLERPAEIRKIVGSTMPPLLAAQIANLKINHVVTDTLYLSIEPRDSARFKLVVDPGPVSFRKGYGRTSNIVVLPDSVQLDGPRSALKNLPDSIIIVLPEKRLNGNFKEEIEVRIPGNTFIKRNPPVVEVIFEVGAIIEEDKKIKLDIINVSKAFMLAQEADSIVCKITIPLNRKEDFKRLTTLKATIDVRDLKKGPKMLLPSITGVPDYATLVHIDSVHLKMY